MRARIFDHRFLSFEEIRARRSELFEVEADILKLLSRLIGKPLSFSICFLVKLLDIICPWSPSVLIDKS